jgi:hypothetical protein
LGSFVFVFQNFCVPQGTRIEGFGHSFVVARNKGGTIILDTQEFPPLKGFKTFLEAYLPHDEVGSLKRVVGTAVNRGCGAYTIASAAWVYAQLMLHADKPFGLPPDPKALYQYYLKSKNILNEVQVLLTNVSYPVSPAPQARDGVHPLTGCPLISFGGFICLNVQFVFSHDPGNPRERAALALLPHLKSDLQRVVETADPSLITALVVSASVAYAHDWQDLAYLASLPMRISMQTFYNRATRHELPESFVYNLTFLQEYIPAMVQLLDTRPNRRRGSDIRPRRR